MCVCVCARSWDLPFIKVLIGHSDAAGNETETSSERQRLLAQRRACCPGLPRGLVRVPVTRAPPIKGLYHSCGIMTVIILSIIYPQQSESCGSFMVLIWDGVIAISSSVDE